MGGEGLGLAEQPGQGYGQWIKVQQPERQHMHGLAQQQIQRMGGEVVGHIQRAGSMVDEVHAPQPAATVLEAVQPVVAELTE